MDQWGLDELCRTPNPSLLLSFDLFLKIPPAEKEENVNAEKCECCPVIYIGEASTMLETSYWVCIRFRVWVTSYI